MALDWRGWRAGATVIALLLTLGVLPGVAAGPTAWAGQGMLTEDVAFPQEGDAGDLRLFTYIPPGLPDGPAPLIVALHGCTQDAQSYGAATGWMEIADSLKMVLLLPQKARTPVLNPNGCFGWFTPDQLRPGAGDSEAIAAMIRRVKAAHAIDDKRVFVTGLSAGGAMTNVMLATHPELFAAGAVIAGVPFGCATQAIRAGDSSKMVAYTSVEAMRAWLGNKTAWGMMVDASQAVPRMLRACGAGSAECGYWQAGVQGANCMINGSHIDNQLGRMVTDIPHRRADGSFAPWSGPWPRVSLWHGSRDTVVDVENMDDSLTQWLAVHGLDRSAGAGMTVGWRGKTQWTVYKRGADAVVETYRLGGMEHAVPVDPGHRDANAEPTSVGCGMAQDYVLDVGVCSSWRIARFFGLTPDD